MSGCMLLDVNIQRPLELFISFKASDTKEKFYQEALERLEGKEGLHTT